MGSFIVTKVSELDLSSESMAGTMLKEDVVCKAARSLGLRVKKVHRRISMEEFDERWSNLRLCMFCGEQETPYHHLQHKNEVILMIECDDDQTFDDKEETRQVRETLTNPAPIEEDVSSDQICDEKELVSIDLDLQEVQTKTVAEEKLNLPNGQNIDGKRFELLKSMGSFIVTKAEELVEKVMKRNDASHDASHVWRVRDLALSIAREEGLSSSSDSMEIVELAALLHDIGDYKYISDPLEAKLVENFLDEEGIEVTKKMKILTIINGMGFKDELAGAALCESLPEFGVVQDADRLDAIGAIGIARCFTFGGSRNRVLHDPEIKPRTELTKEQYIKREEQTTINHFHEKLLKLKKLMKTEAGRRRAEKRHKFMEEFLKEFYEEWDGSA